MTTTSPTFGDPGTPKDPLVACPACVHVAKPISKRGNRYKCAGCGAIVRAMKVPK